MMTKILVAFKFFFENSNFGNIFPVVFRKKSEENSKNIRKKNFISFEKLNFFKLRRKF